MKPENNELDASKAKQVRAPDPWTSVPDLSQWYDRNEVCNLLKISQRWLNEQLSDGGLIIERRQREIKGIPRGSRRKRYETCYRPEDVDRIAAAKAAPPPVVVPEAAKVYRGYPPPNPRLPADPRLSGEMLQLLHEVMQLLASRRALDRGPWMTIPEAADHTGLSRAFLRRVVKRMFSDKHEDVILDGALKIRQAALADLDPKYLAGRSEESADDPPTRGISGFSAIG